MSMFMVEDHFTQRDGSVVSLTILLVQFPYSTLPIRKATQTGGFLFGGAEGNRVNQGVARSSPRQRRSSAPHLIGSIPLFKYHKKEKPPKRVAFFLVEPRGIEPLSESNLEGLSPGAVYYLHSLDRTGTNTLTASVAS